MITYKRLVRILTILVVGMFTFGCLTAAPVVGAKKQPPEEPQKIFVLVPGINTSLTKDQAHSGVTPDFEAVQAAIKETVPDAKFVTFSYNGFVGKKDPKPKPYTCTDTHETPIGVEMAILDKQVQAIVSKSPSAEVYLIGHSMGGVIAFGYMGGLQVGAFEELPNNNLRGVITLDSPLGGVTTDPTYQDYTTSFFLLSCPKYSVSLDVALMNLRTLFSSAFEGSVPLAGHASVLSIPIPGYTPENPESLPDNQSLAESAQENGTSILTVGNTLDRLWIPDTCDLPILHFRHTQWLVNASSDFPGVYGRAITSSALNCPFDMLFNRANHFDTLSHPSVLEGIQQFINGEVPSAIPFAPGES